MAITPEKNDIDISRLFVWGKKVELIDSDGDVIIELYMRVISDEDLNRARVFALRKASELRKKLKLPDSDERLAYILEKEDFDAESIIETILVTELPDLASKIFTTINIPFPREPRSDSSQEIIEKYQEELDTYEDRRTIAIRGELDKITKQRREEYLGMGMDKLYKMYESSIINDLCQKEMLNQFKNYTVFCACFTDEEFKNKLFQEVSNISKLPSELRDQLINTYDRLDISTEDLKK